MLLDFVSDFEFTPHIDTALLFFLSAPILYYTQYLTAKNLLRTKLQLSQQKCHDGLSTLSVHPEKSLQAINKKISTDFMLPFVLLARDVVSSTKLSYFFSIQCDTISSNDLQDAFPYSFGSLIYHFIVFSVYRDFLYKRVDKSLSSDPIRHAVVFLIFLTILSSVFSKLLCEGFVAWVTKSPFMFDTCLSWAAMYVYAENVGQCIIFDDTSLGDEKLELKAPEPEPVSVSDKFKENKTSEHQPISKPKPKLKPTPKPKLKPTPKPKPKPTPKPKPKPTPTPTPNPALKQQSKTSASRRSHGILDSTHLVKLNGIITCVNEIMAKCFTTDKAPNVPLFKDFSKNMRKGFPINLFLCRHFILKTRRKLPINTFDPMQNCVIKLLMILMTRFLMLVAMVALRMKDHS